MLTMFLFLHGGERGEEEPVSVTQGTDTRSHKPHFTINVTARFY